MLHLRRAGLLALDALTASGAPLGEMLDWWEHSSAAPLRALLRDRGRRGPRRCHPGPDSARRRGLTSHRHLPQGQPGPRRRGRQEHAIDPSLLDSAGVYRHTGPARVFTTEPAAIAAIKDGRIQPGDVLVLIGRGPLGAAWKRPTSSPPRSSTWISGKHVAVLTDARFSGVSTGACIGHISPEALAGGPLGRLQDGDLVEIVIDPQRLEGSVNLVGAGEAARLLASRPPHPALAPDPALPNDTRLWAALQSVSGGVWGGCVFDTDAILRALGTPRTT